MRGMFHDRVTPHRRAMTLVEVLVAAVVLGVGVAGLLEVGVLALRNQQRVAHRTTAFYLAQAKIAEVETVGPYAWAQTHPMQGAEAAGDMLCEWALSIDAFDVGQLYRVHTRVGWTSPVGRGDVELETWLNDYEQREPTWAQEPRGPGAAQPGR